MDSLQLVQGLSIGYEFSSVKNSEDEVKQGKNYYLSSLFQAAEIAYCTSLIKKISTSVFQKSIPSYLSFVCNNSFFIYLPFGLACATVKQGDYENLVEQKIPLPKKLRPITTKTLNFFAEHAGDLLRVAILVENIALAYLGQYAFAGAFLSAFVYREIDMLGFVPHKVSLFMETYMPIVSTLGLAITGNTLVLRTLALTEFSAYLNRSIIYKVEPAVRYIFSCKGPTLEEYEQPWVEQKNLTFEEMNEILDSSPNSFEINPAHCSKNVAKDSDLPKDEQLQDFLTLFNQINWQTEGKYQLIAAKLKRDDRFCDFLRKEFPNENNIRQNFEELVQELARQENQSKEKYLATWITEQISTFTDVLLHNKTPKGSRNDLQEGIENSKKILYYVKNLQDNVHKEDLLLKLAVEGGDYCALAIKRATKEIIQEAVLPHGFSQEVLEQFDAQKSYELSILQALQNERFRLVQEKHSKISSEISAAITMDVHIFDLLSDFIFMGFYPIRDSKRKRVNMIDIAYWTAQEFLRSQTLQDYKSNVTGIIKAQGEQRFITYLLQFIDSHQQLTDEQKLALREKYSLFDNDNWNAEETNERFYRLMLVMLGVLKLS